MGIRHLNADLFISLTADLTLLKIFMAAYLASLNYHLITSCDQEFN